MKILLTYNSDKPKVLLDDGTDITKDLKITQIIIRAQQGNMVSATLTVYPSEVAVEMPENQLELRKHPDWEIIKQLSGNYGEFSYSPGVVLGDNFGRGI